jgi:hypothetical protein
MSFNPHPGDEVTIRTWDDIVKTCSLDSNGYINTYLDRFSEEQMKPYCGRTFTVEEIVHYSKVSLCGLRGANYNFPFQFLVGCPASYEPPTMNDISQPAKPIFSWNDIISQYGDDISSIMHGDIFTPGNYYIAEKVYSGVALRVGDVVTVRDWDDMKKEFHLYSPDTIRFPGTDILMTSKKRQFCNGTYKIKNIPWVPFYESPVYEFEGVPNYEFPIQCIASRFTSFNDRR